MGSRTYRGFKYNNYNAMIQRCHNPASQAYGDYGARGIEVYPPWRESFERFVDDLYNEIGRRPKGLQLDRADNSKGYEPGNLRWATRTEQANNKRNNCYLTLFGRTATPRQWVESGLVAEGLTVDRIHDRKAKGWGDKKTLSLPVRGYELLMLNGRRLTRKEWATEAGVPYKTFMRRLYSGWSLEEAVYGKEEA